MKNVQAVLLVVVIIIIALDIYIVFVKNNIPITQNNFTQTTTITPLSIYTTTTTFITSPTISLSKNCSSNLDCSWTITNCCTENTGGSWECINSNTSTIICPSIISCPSIPCNPDGSCNFSSWVCSNNQFCVSKQPSQICSCKQGVCSS